jgi:hypothetical protein
MQINPLTLATATTPAAAAAGVQVLRITAGDVSQIQTGMTAAVRVLTGGSGEAVVDLGGRPVTVRGALSLTAGDVLNVRVNTGSNPTLEVVGRQTELPTKTPTASAPPPTAEPRAAVADVIRQEPNGQVRVTLDGEETVATSHFPKDALQPGGRHVVQVERSPAGVAVRPLPETPQLPTQVAAALLRTDRPPPLADALPPLLRELDALPPQPKSHPAAAAATVVREAVRAITPAPDQPPTVQTLKAVVRDGGQQFEAKLAALVAPAGVTDPGGPAVPSTDTSGRPAGSSPTLDAGRPTPASQTAGAAGATPADPSALKADRPASPPAVASEPDTPPDAHAHDLKGGLLKLLKAVPDLAPALPMTTAVLDGIERQQAVNVLAQQNGGLYVFQVPFPDGPHWRTLSLGVEPDRAGGRDPAGRPTGFRVMMHVPLSELGETWIDAGADGPRLRAVLYLSDEAGRDRLRPDLPELGRELRAAGFADVLLDVRPAADLTDRQRRRANAMRAGAPEGGGMLDVRA